jgi:hypothetical protein
MKSQPKGKQKKIHRHIGDVVMSNTVYVNKNYPFNDLNKMIFVSIVAAYDYIIRYGAVSSKNKWRILCAPGEDVSIVTNPNVYVWDGSMLSMNISLSNNVWVNQDAAQDNPDMMIFTSPESAYAWILANGNLSETNPWVINLPAGLIPLVILHQDVMYNCPDGSIIDELRFDMDFTGITDIFRSYITGAVINKLVGYALKCGYLCDCIVKDVEPIDDSFAPEDTEEENPLQCYVVMNSCSVYKGDLQNYTVADASYSTIVPLLGDIDNLTYKGNNIKLITENISGEINIVGNTHHIGGIFNPTTFENILVENAYCYDIEVTSDTAKFDGCVFDDLTISGGSVNTRGCTIIGTFTKTGGTWANKGDIFDSEVSGIPVDDMQSAIDALAIGTMNKLSEQVVTEVYAWTRLDAVGEDNVLNNETITLNLGETDEEVYTFKTTLTEPAVPGEILIGANILESISNAATVIDAESLITDAAFTTPSTFISNKIAGSTGNGITVATSSAALSLLYATLQGGGDEYTINIRDGKYRDITVYDDTFIYLNPQGEDRNMQLELTLRQEGDAGNHPITIQSTEGNIYSPSGAGYTPTLTAGAIDIVKLRWSGTEWFMTVDLDNGMPS